MPQQTAELCCCTPFCADIATVLQFALEVSLQRNGVPCNPNAEFFCTCSKWFDCVHWLSVMTIHMLTASSELNNDVLRLMCSTLRARGAYGESWGQGFLCNCLPCLCAAEIGQPL